MASWAAYIQWEYEKFSNCCFQVYETNQPELFHDDVCSLVFKIKLKLEFLSYKGVNIPTRPEKSSMKDMFFNSFYKFSIEPKNKEKKASSPNEEFTGSVPDYLL